LIQTAKPLAMASQNEAGHAQALITLASGCAAHALSVRVLFQ